MSTDGAILFTAFEPSGDALASALITRLRERGCTRPIFAMGGPLMQGYLLARPEPAPTSFNLTFPEGEDEPAHMPAAAAPTGFPAAENRAARTVRQFGRRGT